MKHQNRVQNIPVKNSIELNVIAGLVTTDFVRLFKKYLNPQYIDVATADVYGQRLVKSYTYIPYLKMKFQRRLKLMDKLIAKMEKEYVKEIL